MTGRAVLRPRLAVVVQPGCRNVGMAEPLLDLGDVGLVREGVGSSGGAQGVHAQAVHFGADAGGQAVMANDVPVDGSGIERAIQFFGSAVVLDRPEEAQRVLTVP